ncbi:hypothetical protein GCM10009086_30930 [Pseudomonas rhodesiae]
MLAVGKHYRHSCLVVSIKFAIGQAQLIEQIQIKGVALGHPVKPQQQDMSQKFTTDAATAGLIHGTNPRVWRKVSDRRGLKVR